MDIIIGTYRWKGETRCTVIDWFQRLETETSPCQEWQLTCNCLPAPIWFARQWLILPWQGLHSPQFQNKLNAEGKLDSFCHIMWNNYLPVWALLTVTLRTVNLYWNLSPNSHSVLHTSTHCWFPTANPLWPTLLIHTFLAKIATCVVPPLMTISVNGQWVFKAIRSAEKS